MTYATAITMLGVPWAVAAAIDPDGWVSDGCFSHSGLFVQACARWDMNALEFVAPVAEVK